MKNKLITFSIAIFLASATAWGSGVFFSLKVPDNSITSAKVADGTITAEDVADNSLTADKFQPGQITVDDDSITSAKIIDGQVMDNDLANGSVNSLKIVDGAVDSIDIADNAVTSAKIAAFSVADNDLSNGSVGSLQVANSTLTLQTGNDTTVLNLESAGPLTDSMRLTANSFQLDNDGSLRISGNWSAKDMSQNLIFVVNEAGDFEIFQRGFKFESGFGLNFANDTTLTGTASELNVSVGSGAMLFNINSGSTYAEITGGDFAIDNGKKFIFDGIGAQSVYIQHSAGNPSLDVIGATMTIEDGEKIDFGGFSSGKSIYADSGINPNTLFIDGNVDFNGNTITVTSDLVLSGIGSDTGTVLVRNGSDEVVLSTETYVLENSNPTFGTITASVIDTENFSATAGVRLDPQSVAAGNASVDTDTVFVHKTAITGGGDTLTLPNPSGQSGKIVIIIDVSGTAGTNNITVLPFGAELINGAASATISVHYGVLRLQTDGTNWFAF